MQQFVCFDRDVIIKKHFLLVDLCALYSRQGIELSGGLLVLFYFVVSYESSQRKFPGPTLNDRSVCSDFVTSESCILDA